MSRVVQIIRQRGVKGDPGTGLTAMPATTVIGNPTGGPALPVNVPMANLPVSTATQTALDAKAALSHTHGNVTNAGAIGSTTNLPLITGASGVIQVGSFGTTANTFCQGNDPRLSDARTPTAHNQAAETITSGTLDNARLSAQVARRDQANTFTDIITVNTLDNSFRFRNGAADVTPTFSIGSSSQACCLLAGTSGSGLAYSSEGSFVILTEPKATIDAAGVGAGTPRLTLTSTGACTIPGSLASGPLTVTGTIAANMQAGVHSVRAVSGDLIQWVVQNAFGGSASFGCGTGGSFVAFSNSIPLFFYPETKANIEAGTITGSVTALQMTGTTAVFGGSITATTLVNLGTYTVGTLPSASANSGALAQVTDSNSATNGNTVAGGGSNRVPVFSNGTNWIIK